ncbi:MAG: hypothetical protein IJX74_00750 [Clostridia bacterium]|nr:hypothetical protein [Clostridia bacterium]
MRSQKDQASRAHTDAAWNNILLTLFLFASGGTLYYLMELGWRGWSHPTMGLLGGLCFYFIYHANRFFHHRSLAFRAFLGAVIITALELLAGCILNIFMGMNIWDYSSKPLNFLGQICFSMSVLWFLLSVVACILSTLVRKYVFEYPLLVDTAHRAVSADAMYHSDKDVGSKQ